jgi:hypothetical protein
MKVSIRALIPALMMLALVMAGCGVLQPAPTPTATVNPELAELQPAIDSILFGSVEDRRTLVQFVTTPCTTAGGLGGPPKCAGGQADGTMVEVFPISGPEGTFASPADIDGALQFTVKSLAAVYRVTNTVTEGDYWPAGEYGLLFDREEGGMAVPMTILVQDGKFVRINYHLGSTVADVLAGIPAADLIALR